MSPTESDDRVAFAPALLVLAWLLLSPIAAAGVDAADEKAKAADGAVVAAVGDRTITRVAFEAEMRRLAAGRPGQFAAAEDRRELLERLVGRELLVAAARRAGYDRHPDVVAAYERMMAAKFQEETIDARLAAVEVTAEEVEAFHAENRELYEIPGRARAALVRVSAPAEGEGRERSRRRIEEAREAALTLGAEVAHFGKVAVTYSDDGASRFVGGDIGTLAPGRAYRWPAEVVETVFAIAETGGISPVIETADAFWIVRLSERTETAYRPLAQAAPAIRHELVRRRAASATEAFFAELEAEIPVRVDEALLAAIAGPVFDLRPPAVPGGKR